jgi:hypothetical protein
MLIVAWPTKDGVVPLDVTVLNTLVAACMTSVSDGL